MASPPADYSMGPPISGESTPAGRGRGRGRGSRGGASGESRSRGKGSRGGSTGERGASRGGTGSRGGRGAKPVGAGGPGSRGAGGPGSRGGRGSRGARGSSASKRSTSASTAPVRERSTSTQVARRPGSDDEEIAGPSTAQIADVEDDADDGEDEYEDAEVEESWEDEGWARQKALNDAKKANLSALLNAMSSDQYNRHEVYLRQSINKNVVRRIITNAIGGQTIPQELASLAGGMAKVFVGELVEKARALRAEQDPQDTGPLHPAYYHEAYRQYKAEREQPGMYPQGGGAPGLGKRRRMF